MTKQIRNPNPKGAIAAADSDCVVAHCFGFRSSSCVIRLCLAAALLLATAPVFASVETWTTEKGLPENSVFSVLQTRDGYLWLGTGYGLARFDGIHFKTFDETDAPGLNSGKILGLFEDSRGNLWIGTETEGILIADKQGKISRLKDAGRGLEGKLGTICEDSSGAIWFSTAISRVLRYRDGQVDLKVD